MTIALPLTDTGRFSLHFGGSSRVALFEVDATQGRIMSSTEVQPPESGPCSWADWLRANGVSLVLAGGMGPGARQRMASVGIQTIVGLPDGNPTQLVESWLKGSLETGTNACGGHSHEHGHQHDGAGCGCQG